MSLGRLPPAVARALLVAAPVAALVSAFALLGGGDPLVLTAPIAVGFLATATLLGIAGAQLDADGLGATILATAAATTFVSLGSLTAASVGDLAQPGASLALLAAWATALARPSRLKVLAFLVYLAIGAAVAFREAGAVRGPVPWQLPAILVLQWPWTLAFPVSPSAQVPVAIGIIAVPALPLLAWYVWRAWRRPARGVTGPS